MHHNAVVGGLWIVTGLCVTVMVYPYALYPLILRALPARPAHRGTLRSDRGSEFALLFSAHNEAEALPDKIENLCVLRAAYPELELLAYDDCSSDGTADTLENSGLGIRVVRGSQRAGKAHGMKLLASLTEREFLVFTDANVELAPNALHELRAAYANPAVGGVCGLLQYVDTEGTPTGQTGGWYWRLDEMIKSLESRTGNVMGADGSIFSMRSSLYPDFPDTVLDDLTVSMAVIFQGRRLIKDPLVIARERLVASRQDDFHRRIRIATRSFHTHLWLRPKLRSMTVGDRWRYWSHRYLRWHGAFFLAIGYLSGLAALALTWGWAAAGIALAATLGTVLAGMYFRQGYLSAIVHILSSILLTGLGVIRARQGHTMTTWKPPTR